MPSRGRVLAAALAFCEVGVHASCGIRSCREHEGPVSRFPFDLDLGLLWSTVGGIRRAEWALQSFSVIFFSHFRKAQGKQLVSTAKGFGLP